MMKDDWSPSGKTDQYLTQNLKVKILPVHGERWLTPLCMTDQYLT